MRVIDERMVCVDCYFFIANGERPVDPDDGWNEPEIADWSAGVADDEVFSWSACDLCGSGLGGSRHHVVRLA